MLSDAGTPYLDMIIRDSIHRHNRRSKRRKLSDGPDLAVVHHETCPCCGKKLVNIYLRNVEKIVVERGEHILKKDREWKCKVCWDKGDANAKTEETPSR